MVDGFFAFMAKPTNLVLVYAIVLYSTDTMVPDY